MSESADCGFESHEPQVRRLMAPLGPVLQVSFCSVNWLSWHRSAGCPTAGWWSADGCWTPPDRSLLRDGSHRLAPFSVCPIFGLVGRVAQGQRRRGQVGKAIQMQSCCCSDDPCDGPLHADPHGASAPGGWRLDHFAEQTEPFRGTPVSRAAMRSSVMSWGDPPTNGRPSLSGSWVTVVGQATWLTTSSRTAVQRFGLQP